MTVALIECAERAAQLRKEYDRLGIPGSFQDWLCLRVFVLESSGTASEKLLADEIAAGIAVRETLKERIHSLEGRLAMARSDGDRAYDEGYRDAQMGGAP